jgi:CHASE1-domain containing sensor protein
MSVLDIVAASTTDSSGVRVMLLALVLVAIILLLTGCTLALLTLRNQRRATRIAVERLESEKS